MTGEVTLRGEVLPVGGIKEKIIGAKTFGVRKLYLPIENKRDVECLEKEITSGIRFIYVDNYIQIFDSLFIRRSKKKENHKFSKNVVS